MKSKREIVKIQTWGTSDPSSPGLSNVLKAKYRGENVGHAALEMELTATESNIAMIKKYCDKIPRIPYKIKTVMKEDGTTEEIYLVRFSFIPNDYGPFSLNANYTDDTNYERIGHHTTNRDILESSETVERRSKDRVISLFPLCSLTEKGRSLDFTTPQGQYVLKLKEVSKYSDLLQTLDVANKKVGNLKKNITSIDLNDSKNRTLSIAAKRLGIKLPEQGKIPVQEFKDLLSTAKSKIRSQIDRVETEIKELTKVITKEDEKKIYSKKVIEAEQIIKKLKNSEDGTDYENLVLKCEEYSLSFPILSEEFNALSQIKTKEEFIIRNRELQEALTSLITNYKTELTTIAKEDLFFSHIDDYVCYGRPADGEVHLPLGSGENELDPSAMLEQMRNIADSSHKYNLYSHNCSTTVSSILKAGKTGKASKLPPIIVISTTTPQTIYNETLMLRDKVCKVSASTALANLDAFYAERTGAKTLSRDYSNLHQAILGFALDNIFPEDEDKENNTFYILSNKDKNSLLELENTVLPTELLRDLWNLIPNRTLPLSKDGSNDVVIDKNMTIGQMIQGLSILSQNNAEIRLNIQPVKPVELERNLSENLNKEQPVIKDSFEILRSKIESEILRLGQKKDIRSIKKYIEVLKVYSMVIHELNSEGSQKTSQEKSLLLYQAVIPTLKINTGLNLVQSTSFKEVKKTALELGIIKSEKAQKAVYKEWAKSHKVEEVKSERAEGVVDKTQLPSRSP